jgi:hypothetical protein
MKQSETNLGEKEEKKEKQETDFFDRKAHREDALFLF